VLESGIVLGNAEAPLQSDLLSVRDLVREKLHNSLVTLSACETARGDVAVSDFLGLSRASLVSGCRAVIATLWPIENRPTRDLMLEFYKRLQNPGSAGNGYGDIAECLRQSQLAVSAVSETFNWAAFKVIGWPLIAIPDGK
jgi:CHAT domain-containing protein